VDDKTQIYSNNNKTTVYQEAEKRTKPSVHNLHPGDKIVLNNKSYEILDIISENTGEAVIYKIKNKAENPFALKLYFEFKNPENEPNTEALERIKKIKDVDILRLHDFGTGTSKYKGKYCFEIADFANGSDLLSLKNIKEKYLSDFLIDEVVPQIFKGILTLHNNRIYHCDLKPQNVFYLDKQQLDIVIGDYGSAKTFEFDATKNSRKTTTVKGSDFYLPPEQARGFISEKNDYYSFGMILLHLFYPEKILLNINEPKSLSHEKLKTIIERQFESKPIIDFNPEYERINQLIKGLTLVDFNLRWGQEEVQKWLNGEAVEVFYNSAQSNKVDLDALVFDEYTINTPEDLRDYILTDKNWYADLIEDTDNREDFTNWMLGLYNGDKSKRSELNRIIKNYSPEGIEFVGDALIRFFLPDHPVTFGFKNFDFSKSDDLKKTTAEAFSYLIQNLWNSSSDNDLRFYIFSYESALSQLQATNDEAKIALNKLVHVLNAENSKGWDSDKKKKFSWENITKNSLNLIEQFLVDYLPSVVNIHFSDIKKFNELHYTLSKSLTGYFKEIGINLKLEQESSQNTATIAYPSDYKSFDDFLDITISHLINEICIQDSIDKELLTTSSQEKFAKEFKINYNKQIGTLSDEYNQQKKEFRGIRGLENYFDELKTSLTKKYELIPYNHRLIDTIRKEGKRLKKIQAKENERLEAFRKIQIKSDLRILRRTLFLAFIIMFFWPLYQANKNVINKSMLLKGVELVPVEGSTFRMGRNHGNQNESPRHTVVLDDFFIGKYEVTNAQFAIFLNDYGNILVKSGQDSGQQMIQPNGWNIRYEKNTWEPVDGWENHPVQSVSWYGANEFAKWAGGRLPTEAEWEYVAQGGKDEKPLMGLKELELDSIAWYIDNAGSRPEEVGTQTPNKLEVFDMYGNVWEWCHDFYDARYYRRSPRQNPCNTRKTYKTLIKTIRGGAYNSHKKEANPFFRDGKGAETMQPTIGFRICWVNEYKK
jgi:formylglycine-generating enzyme required for sulfatase activity